MSATSGSRGKGRADYVPTPLNYTGSKFRLLPQILPLMDMSGIDRFDDIFCGGGVVSANVLAENPGMRIRMNDLEEHLMSFYAHLATVTDIEDFIEQVTLLRAHYGLSDVRTHGYAYYGADSGKGLGSVNKAGYMRLRDDYNAWLDAGKDGPALQIMFYLLVVYAFNNQIRYNSKGRFNLPVGKRDLNARMLQKLRAFHACGVLPAADLTCLDFRDVAGADGYGTGDFVYADPPYLITLAAYNERGGWTEQDDADLMSLLDDASDAGARFAMSNVLEHNGRRNDRLAEWAEDRGYEVHHLNFDYNNSNYHSTAKNGVTDEVLITG